VTVWLALRLRRPLDEDNLKKRPIKKTESWAKAFIQLLYSTELPSSFSML
jgi:hypothetical protein